VVHESCFRRRREKRKSIQLVKTGTWQNSASGIQVVPD
jgi:hypothetical protein